MPDSALADELHRLAPALSREAIEAAIDSAQKRARGLTPDLAAVARRLSQGRAEEVVLDDLLIAAACERGDRAAIAYLERQVLPSVRPSLRRFGDDAEIDEVLQLVRERLLLGAPPRIAQYAATAPLTAWIRVTAVRVALNERRGAGDARSADEAVLEQMVGASGAQLPKALDRARFEAVFRAALAMLSSDQRSALRMYFVDGFTVERIATMYGVNKSTASRRIAAARAQLFAGLRGRLREELGLELEEVRSLVRWVRSQVDVGLSQLLGSAPAQKARNE